MRFYNLCDVQVRSLALHISYHRARCLHRRHRPLKALAQRVNSAAAYPTKNYFRKRYAPY